MNPDISEKLSVFCMSLFTVMTVSTAGAGSLVVGGAGTLLALPALWRSYLNWSDRAEKRAVKAAAKAALSAYRNSARRNHDLPSDAVAPAEAALANVVDLIALDPAKIGKAHWNMAALPDLIVSAAAAGSREYAEHTPDPQAVHNRALLRFLAERIFAALQALPDFEATVMPAFRQDVIGRLAEFGRKQDVQTTMLEELLRRIPATTEGQRAQSSGVPEVTIIALARRISESIEDLDTALAEIDRAISVAVEVRADAARGHNFGSELDEIFNRLAELTNEGRLAEAAEEADWEIAQWEEKQTELQAQGLALLEAGIRQDILNRDASGTARKIVRKLELETADASGLFAALRAVRDEWFVRGRDMGLNFDLEVAVALASSSRDLAKDRDQRGVALNDLGIALATRGERESGKGRLEQAFVAFRAVLDKWTHASAPYLWATTMNNLGNTLRMLGERESGVVRLEDAIAAYRSALEVRTRTCKPLEWAETQNNLGNALATLGARESSVVRLEEAAAAFRSALEERTRTRAPLEWAGTQANLGNVLVILGTREIGTVRLEEAAAAFRSALEERTRTRAPLEWAGTQANLGNALVILGAREIGTVRLEEAVVAYRAALEEYTRERVPLLWAMTQNNLGNALQSLGERESGTVRLEEAIFVYRATLEVRTRARVPLDWAATQSNLGNALACLGERESGTKRFEEAVAAFRAALEEYTRAQVPYLWAQTRENMAAAFTVLFERTGDDAYRTEAIVAARDALEVYREAEAEYDIGTARQLLAHLEGDAKR